MYIEVLFEKNLQFNVTFNNSPQNLLFYVETCLYSLIFQIKKHTDQIYFIFGYAEVSNKSVTFLRKKPQTFPCFFIYINEKKIKPTRLIVPTRLLK